jgi:hypothetical protein
MNGSGGSQAGPRVRIGDTEREQFSAALSAHYAEGRLTLDELRRRTEIVLTAEYADQAAAALAELPALPGPGTSAARGTSAAPVGGRGTANRSAQRGLLSRRGHAESARPDPGWERTAERFRDPSSGVIMRVWLGPGGARHYVPDEAPAPADSAE